MSEKGKWFLLLVCTSLLLGLSPRPQVSGKKLLVLRGATVIDGLGNPSIPDAVIVIDGDRIKAVGGKNTAFPSDAMVVEASGKFIIPGLVDSHVHYQPWLAELFLNYGVTTIMAQGGDISPADREASHQAVARMPRIYATGGRPALQPNMTREQVRTTVQEWVKSKKPDWANPTVYNESNAQVFQWAAEDLHEAGLAWFGHTENAPQSIKAGEDVVEHIWGFAEPLMSANELEGFQKGEYLHWGLFLRDQRRIDEMIKEAVAKNTYLNPTLVYELGAQSSLGPKFQAELRTLFQNQDLMTYFPKNMADGSVYKFQTARNFSRRYENLADFSVLRPNDKKQFDEAYRLSGQFLKKWVATGGKIIAGTDDPSAGFAGLTLHMEMQMLVESGLTPAQALQAATSWGSAALLTGRKAGAKPPVGMIAEGAYADLVLLNGNPLDNIANTKKIDRVMKGGQFIKLGYTRNFGTPRGGAIIPRTQEPEISALLPSAIDGAKDVELVIRGVGFIGKSVVRVGETPVPTTFVDIRTLRAKIPASTLSKESRNQAVTVFNKPPDGGVSNTAFLKYGAANSTEPQIIAIAPYRVVEGESNLELTVSGVGFTSNSVVRVGEAAAPTTFVDSQTLRAKVPADPVARALPNRFNAPGPGQNNGVYGDRTVKISVSNGASGTASNSLALRVIAKWMANEKEN
jgi:Amidohydrolase family/IPT/TIG domain